MRCSNQKLPFDFNQYKWIFELSTPERFSTNGWESKLKIKQFKTILVRIYCSMVKNINYFVGNTILQTQIYAKVNYIKQLIHKFTLSVMKSLCFFI